MRRADRPIFVDLTHDPNSELGTLPPPTATASSSAQSVSSRLLLSGNSSRDRVGDAMTSMGQLKPTHTPTTLITSTISRPRPYLPDFVASVPLPPPEMGESSGKGMGWEHERAAKRLRLSQPNGEQGLQPLNNSLYADMTYKHQIRYGERPIHYSGERIETHPIQAQAAAEAKSAVNGFVTHHPVHTFPAPPSAQFVNEALKSKTTASPHFEQVLVGKPQPFQVASRTHDASQPDCTLQNPTTLHQHEVPRISSSKIQPSSVVPFHTTKQKIKPLHVNIAPRSAQSFNVAEGNGFSNSHKTSLNFNKNGAVLTVLGHDDDSQTSTSSRENVLHQDPIHPFESFSGNNTSIPVPKPTQVQPRKKFTAHFTEEEDHYLIFLKEVKRFQWKQITLEFNKDFPGRTYPVIQTHYSQVVNKRDRSLDPPTLKLPERFADEAAIDWSTVHSKSAAPQVRIQRDISTRNVRQSIEERDGEENVSTSRPRRAVPINYSWPRGHRNNMKDNSNERDGSVMLEESYEGSVLGSESLSHQTPPLITQAAIRDYEPLQLDDVEALDAELALQMRKHTHARVTRDLPYLAMRQRQSIQKPPDGWEWEQVPSQQWQETLIHVDFNSNEVATVYQVVSDALHSRNKATSHREYPKLRAIMRGLTDPQLLRITDNLRRMLNSRSEDSIRAFLQDAQMGTIAESPRAFRIAAARSNTTFSTGHEQSTLALLGQRELGRSSRRGWPTSSTPITYMVRNKYMDTLGPSSSWTGASSDIHAVAWSPDGETFAAAAIAVDDPDSMQYNRPNNLLYGNIGRNMIHELGEHFKQRPKTEKGVNSTHAMFASQDPRLYSTVSSVAFSPSGRLMYSAGYDETVCIWRTDNNGEQPSLGAKLNVKAQLDMLSANSKYPGVLAVAAKINADKAIRLLKIDEDDPSQFSKTSFHSSKALSRADLKILPTALKFEPREGHLLLAGFGATARDSGFDTTGELCLWDLGSQQQLSIHGSNRNVFDVGFNPNRRHLPVFAAGCVAGGNVNRGVRSLIRLYDLHGPKYSCPLEIECRALDMNDVVWCPYDEHLLAVGCTDGKAYVWDVRNPTDPLHILSHGPSLMPLQDGVNHEVTDTGVRFLSWGNNTTRLYSGSSDGAVKVWNVAHSAENAFVRTLTTCDSGIMSGAFSADMSRLVVGEVNGSVSVLEVGKRGIPAREVKQLRHVPYQEGREDVDEDGGTSAFGAITESLDSGVVTAFQSLQSGQLQTVAMGGLPVRQVVQGPNYTGPYDQSVDAPFLRQQALEFQLGLAAPVEPQCGIAACKDSYSKITNEEIGDSGRSTDRIPDEIRRTREATDRDARMVEGRPWCSQCGRPAKPPSIHENNHRAFTLCERCCFACLRCGASNAIAAPTETFTCSVCAGVWDMNVLGYENIRQPELGPIPASIPQLTSYGKEAHAEKLADADTSFGDEMNALTDYYHSLAIDQPNSPPL